jgi:hypothetical protein
MRVLRRNCQWTGDVGIEFDPCYSPGLNEFAGGGNGYVAKAAVQLHGRERRVDDFVEVARAARDVRDRSSARGGDLEATAFDVGVGRVSLFV